MVDKHNTLLGVLGSIDYLKLLHIFNSNQKLIDRILYCELYDKNIKKLLLEYKSLASKAPSVIRSIDYVLSFIKNTSGSVIEPTFVSEFDFWFKCSECGAKLLSDSKKCPVGQCSKIPPYIKI